MYVFNNMIFRIREFILDNRHVERGKGKRCEAEPLSVQSAGT